LHRDDQVVVSEINFASARLAQREGDEARAALRRALQLAVRLGDKDHIAYCLDGLAAVDAGDGGARRGAVLVGAAQAIRQVTGTVREPYERELSARTEAELRSELGDDYDAAVDEGRATKTEEAVALALADSAADDVTSQL
jgi:hypothetical protein